MRITKPTPYILLTLIILLTLSSPDLNAQCSMCRAVAESGSNDGKELGAGLNNGILYLLSIPYILGGVAFFIWRKNRRKTTASVVQQ